MPGAEKTPVSQSQTYSSADASQRSRPARRPATSSDRATPGHSSTTAARSSSPAQDQMFDRHRVGRHRGARGAGLQREHRSGGAHAERPAHRAGTATTRSNSRSRRSTAARTLVVATVRGCRQAQTCLPAAGADLPCAPARLLSTGAHRRPVPTPHWSWRRAPGVPWPLNSRACQSAAVALRTAELLDALSTGIVRARSAAVRDLRQRRRAGSAGGQSQSGARPAVRRTVRTTHNRCLNSCAARSMTHGACAGHEIALTRSLRSPPCIRPHVVDLTVTPLEGRSPARNCCSSWPTRTQRQRISRESEMLLAHRRQPADDSPARARDKKSARRPARRGAAARAGAARCGPDANTPRSSSTRRTACAALVDSMLGPSAPPRRRAAQHARDLRARVHLLRREAPPGVSIERDYDPSLPEGHVRSQRDHPGAAERRRATRLQAVAGAGRIVLRTRVR